MTVPTLLGMAVVALAGIVARLYFAQERTARDCEQAYSRLALHVIKQLPKVCERNDCPHRMTCDEEAELRDLLVRPNGTKRIGKSKGTETEGE
jgi:hypothetical protein